MGLTKLNVLTWDYILRRVLPLSIIFFVNIVLGNISLRWVTVSFMQTIKSSVPAFSVILQVLVYKKSFDSRIYLSLIPIVGGVLIATYTESEFDPVGFWAALIASVITAMMAIVSGMLLNKQMDSLNLLYYMAPLSFIMLFPVTVFTELSEIQNVWMVNATPNSYMLLILSGIIAFLLNVTTFLVIAHTSALTFNIAGNFKVIFSIVISVLIFKNKISIVNGLGCAIAIVGVIYYNQIKMELSKPALEVKKDTSK